MTHAIRPVDFDNLKTMTYEVTDRIARITFNRPDKGNAIVADTPLELSALVERADLDPDVHVILVSGRGEGFCAGFDLSAYADVADLYLAADVMVSDYSSTQFDFAVLRRPIIHFAYDLDRYRDDVRGMYYDYRRTCPGPVVSTSDELFDALEDLDGVRRRMRTPLAAFADMFCHLDDGHATERVLDLVLPRLLWEDECSRRSA